MIRNLGWSALLLAFAALGCGTETDNTDVNNTLPQTQNTTPPAKEDAGAGGPSEEAKKKAAMGAPDSVSIYPKNYPGMNKGAGAGEAKEGDKKEGEKKEGESKEGENKEAPKTAAVDLTPDELAAIKELPEADQKLALAQGVCLVNEEGGKAAHLGSMGKPYKTEVKGQVVFLCCDGCEKALKQDPDKYLAKLKK
jgi:hypothetical protein